MAILDGKELPPNIGLYENVFSTTPKKQIHLLEFLALIQRGDQKTKIGLLRDAVARGDAADQTKYKESLPMATISGIFPPHKRNAASIVSHSGFIVMDFDGDKKMDNAARAKWAAEAKTKLKADPYVYSVFYSCRGLGLAAIVKIKDDAKYHKAHFEWLVKYYKEKLGLVVDKSGADVSRPRYISYDPECHWNDGSLTVPFDMLPVAGQSAATPQAALAAVAKPVRGKAKPTPEETRCRIFSAVAWIGENKIDIAPDYDTWLKVAFAFRGSCGDLGKGLFLQAVSYSRLFDAEASAKLYDGLGDKPLPEKPITIGTFLKNCSDARKAKAKEDDEYKGPILKSVLDHILAKYPGWAVNELTGVLTDADNVPVSEGWQLDVCVEVAESLRERDVPLYYLVSAVKRRSMPTYDPVRRMLDRQEKKPRDEKAFDKLMGIYNWEGEHDVLFMKKFLAGFFEAYFKPGKNRIALVLSGPKNVGKSLLLLNIFPPVLRGFTTIMRKLDDDNLISRNLTSMMLTIVDEADRLSREARLGLKSLVSQQVFNWNKKYAVDPSNEHKRGLMAFTTNEEEFLEADDGNSRFMFCRMGKTDDLPEDIERRFEEVDLYEVWYQLYLFWKDKKHILSREEWGIMNDSGDEFAVQTTVGAALGKHFAPGSPVIKGSVFLTPTEIIDILKSEGVDAKMGNAYMGRELQGAGFEREHRRCGKKWICDFCAGAAERDAGCKSRKKGYWVRRVTGVNVPMVGLANPNEGPLEALDFTGAV